ncbi:Nn.00g053590.m01.CDS01 [Neocucurbitaria sp. VM-36]
MTLPTLDFDNFLHGTHEAKLELGIALVKSFKDFGFVKLLNHGIPEKVVKDYLDMAVAYFKLPRATKEAMANVPGPFPQRGWSCVGAEQTARVRKENLKDSNGEDMEDSKEHVDIGPFEDKEYPNRWPKEEDLPGFRKMIKKCYDLFQRTSLEIISAMELGLELPQAPLRTDHVGGLELQDRCNPTSFLPVLPAPQGGPSEMVVNISDMLQRWTNDVIQAGVHQVSLPRVPKPQEADGANDSGDGVIPIRHSAVFFFKPHRKTSAGPLPKFVTEDNPAAYDEITALEYHKRMTQVLYAAQA